LAGKIIADIIEAPFDSIKMNVANVTVLTANNSGLTYLPTGNVNINIGSTASLTLGNVVATTANISGLITASGGIKFPATQVASADVNTLDDYEEGTWTPSFTGSTTNPTVSYNVQTGKYTKIGRLVTVSFVCIASGTPSGGSGDILVSGLPFGVSTTSSQAHGFIGIMNNIGVNMSTNQIGLLCQIDGGTSMQVIATSGTSTSSTAALAVAVIYNSGARIDGTFVYMT